MVEFINADLIQCFLWSFLQTDLLISFRQVDYRSFKALVPRRLWAWKSPNQWLTLSVISKLLIPEAVMFAGSHFFDLKRSPKDCSRFSLFPATCMQHVLLAQRSSSSREYACDVLFSPSFGKSDFSKQYYALVYLLRLVLTMSKAWGVLHFMCKTTPPRGGLNSSKMQYSEFPSICEAPGRSQKPATNGKRT